MSIDQQPARARQINTIREHDVCDVCGRTLLRGEHMEGFLAGSRRYEVCELCKSHALHEGWLREGSAPEYSGLSGAPARRRTLFGRLRRRPEREVQFHDPLEDAPPAPQTLDDELSLGDWLDDSSAAPLSAQPGSGSAAPAETSRPARAQRSRSRRSSSDSTREPRHVHAVPTSADHRIAAAIDVFNASPHTRTVAGVARSLGAPGVSVTPDRERPSAVWAVAGWELCWYRYEIDLSGEGESVRLDAQGYELDELADHERLAIASADEAGRIVIV